MKNKSLRVLVYLIILFLIVNIVLFALGILKEILFWIIIIVVAIFAYKVLPRIK